MATKIGINGFGRIGKYVARLLLSNGDLKLVHINDKMTPQMIAHLLKYDSIHGIFRKEITHDDQYVYVEGNKILVTNEMNNFVIPWETSGVEWVVESSGKYRTRELLERHYRGNVKRVILSAPPLDSSINKMIVLGCNEHILEESDHLISNASCTTNCVGVVLTTLLQKFGVEKAFMNTVHPMTNNQNIQDGYHPDFRRARGIVDNIIPTTTSAIRAIQQIIPDLNGRFDGFATSVPVSDCSFVELTAILQSDCTVESINQAFKEASEGSLKPYLDYTEDPIVSSDIKGNRHSAIFDALSTRVLGNRFIQILAWYDNESGYSNRIVDLISNWENIIANKQK